MTRFRRSISSRVSLRHLAPPKASPTRDLGVPFDGTPAQQRHHDVKGVEVGHTTLISGSGKLKVGEGRPHRRHRDSAARQELQRRGLRRLFTLNGNGEMTAPHGSKTPAFSRAIMITNTHSVAWFATPSSLESKQASPTRRLLVVAARGRRNLRRLSQHINGFHVNPSTLSRHRVRPRRPVEEGNVAAARYDLQRIQRRHRTASRC